MTRAALEQLALEVRAEVGVDAHGVLDPYKVADAYGIDVYRLSEYEGIDGARQRLLLDRVEAFSGALLPDGCGGAVIVENDAHSLERRRATMGHEVAHVVCEHPFATTLVNEHGCRLVDNRAERDAKDLSAELLIPTCAAVRMAWSDATDEQVAARFQVSIPFARWRMNAGGARTIVRRSRARRGAGSRAAR